MKHPRNRFPDADEMKPTDFPGQPGAKSPSSSRHVATTSPLPIPHQFTLPAVTASMLSHIDVDELSALPRVTYEIGLRTQFRGITTRRGMIITGPAGIAEWSPFEEYDTAEAGIWLAGAIQAACFGLPTPRRDRVPINVTIPTVTPERARRLVAESQARTAKIKVSTTDPKCNDNATLEADLARVAAVRAELGPTGRIRIDVNGTWSVDQAFTAITRFSEYGLEYVEQPCATTVQLAQLRLRLAEAGIDVKIAADESIRKLGHLRQVIADKVADVVVIKTQPLGGAFTCLSLLDQIGATGDEPGVDVVISSALESSVGINAAVHLAAALDRPPLDCGLNTVQLFTADTVRDSLISRDGTLPVCTLGADDLVADFPAATPPSTAWWEARYRQCLAWLVEQVRLNSCT